MVEKLHVRGKARDFLIMNMSLLDHGGASVLDGTGWDKNEVQRRLLGMNARSGSGQSSDPHLLESGPRALPDTQHDDAASLQVTGDKVLALSIAVLGPCGHDGVSNHPHDTTQHHITPHHTTPHHITTHQASVALPKGELVEADSHTYTHTHTHTHIHFCISFFLPSLFSFSLFLCLFIIYLYFPCARSLSSF